MNALGIDACPSGWVAIHTVDGHFEAAFVRRRFEDLLTVCAFDVIGVDIPIGLPDTPGRAADHAARRFLGPARSSVFLTYPRDVLSATSYDAAKKHCEQAGWPKPSLQSFGMRKGVFEVAAAIEAGGAPIIEVHPELSFRAMAETVDSNMPRGPKSSWAGWLDRRELLERTGMKLPDDLGSMPLIDTLDAAAAAWSAHRFAFNAARRFPEHSVSQTMTIWA